MVLTVEPEINNAAGRQVLWFLYDKQIKFKGLAVGERILTPGTYRESAAMLWVGNFLTLTYYSCDDREK